MNGAVRRKRLSAMDSVQGNVEDVSPPRPHCLSQSQLHNNITTNPSACLVPCHPVGFPPLSLYLGALCAWELYLPLWQNRARQLLILLRLLLGD